MGGACSAVSRSAVGQSTKTKADTTWDAATTGTPRTFAFFARISTTDCQYRDIRRHDTPAPEMRFVVTSALFSTHGRDWMVNAPVKDTFQTL